MWVKPFAMLSGVYCPFCRMEKQRHTSKKKNWCDGQWMDGKADVICSIRAIHRNCCAACSDVIGGYYHAGPIPQYEPECEPASTQGFDQPHHHEPRPKLQPWTFPSEVTDEMFSESWHRLRRIPTEFWTIFHTNVNYYGHDDRNHRWIRQMYHTCGEETPQSVRPLKFLSKFGAVRCRSSGIPRSGAHWIDDDTGMGYIDVSKAIYSFVLDWIWPGLTFTNPGTRGDIVEANLGWSFLVQKYGRQPRSNMSVEFILDLDRVLWHVWTHQSSYFS